MIEALGPVNLELPHTIITIAKQPTVLPWLRRVPLAIGTYVVNGDVRMYLGDRLARRLTAAGVLKAKYVDPGAELIAAVKLAEEKAKPPAINQDLMDMIERAYWQQKREAAAATKIAAQEAVKVTRQVGEQYIETVELINKDQIAAGTDVPHIAVTSGYIQAEQIDSPAFVTNPESLPTEVPLIDTAGPNYSAINSPTLITDVQLALPTEVAADKLTNEVIGEVPSANAPAPKRRKRKPTEATETEPST